LPEIGRIQQIESVGSDLPSQALGELGVLDQREVHVREPWSDYDVAAQISEPSARDQYRGILDVRYRCGRAIKGRREPSLHRSRYVGPDFAADAGQRGVGGMEIDRIPRLQLDDGAEFPAFHEAVSFERQIVDPAQDEAVPRVEVRQTTIVANVVAVLHA